MQKLEWEAEVLTAKAAHEKVRYSSWSVSACQGHVLAYHSALHCLQCLRLDAWRAVMQTGSPAAQGCSADAVLARGRIGSCPGLHDGLHCPVASWQTWLP